jgi:uncharacterized protein
MYYRKRKLTVKKKFLQDLLSLLGKLTRPINPLLLHLYPAAEIVHIQIESHRISSALNGFRIAFISDLHAGPTTPLTYLKKVIDQINNLQPHLVALGGDYVFQDPYFIEPVSTLLGQLKAPYGVFAVFGNHDHWLNVNHLTEAFQREGITILNNTGLRITHNQQSFWLCGVEDLWEGTPEFKLALEGQRKEEFTILLSHNPDYAESINKELVDIMLSGHTHGGQIRFLNIVPVNVSQYKAHYLDGFCQKGGCLVYVSRGIGTVEISLRLGSRPEISFLQLSHRSKL